MSFNLPPGVTEGMIPGNRPEDVAYERYVDGLDEDEMLDWLCDGEYDRPGCVLSDDEGDGTWRLESDEQPWLPKHDHEVVIASNGITYALLRFDSRDDALSYVLAFHDEEVITAMAEEHMESLADEGY